MVFAQERALNQSPGTIRRRSVIALVWAANDQLAVEAVEHLRSGLWPGRHLYEIAEVQELELRVPCPLRRDSPAVLEYELRHGWMWVLISPGTAPEAVAP